MGLFKSKREKEIEKKLLIRKTMANMNKYIADLNNQKQKYLEACKKAKIAGAETQYNLAVSGLKTAMMQQKKAQEMLLNFELTSQMKDMSQMTASFLDGMSVLSKEMAKITNNTDFIKVQNEFEKAMTGVMETSEKLDIFLDESDTAFETIATTATKVDDAEIENLINNQISMDSESIQMNDKIDAELKNLTKKIME